MTKAEIFEAFQGRVSQKAIQFDGIEWGITGKFCRITPCAGGWDLWVCNPANMRVGLGVKKVNNIMAALALKTMDKLTLRKLDGEAYAYPISAELICEHMVLLGIRRKKRLSEESLQRLRERASNLTALRGVN